MSVDIALVTCDRFPHLDEDSRKLLDVLKTRSVTVETVSWTNRDADWTRYKVAVIRSTWDYETRRQDFINWAERVGQLTRLWNPPDVLRWNTDKRYLLELSRKGVRIVPTVWCEGGSDPPVAYCCVVWNCHKLVIKPAVSAGARNTQVVTADQILPVLSVERDWLIQPYLTSIEQQGELSMVFLGGDLAYCVRKRPKAGDFRVQVEHGGLLQQANPTDAELECATRALQAIGKPLLYARIDLMYGDDGEPLLSEAEVTEPSLYHLAVPESAAMLADRIEALVVAGALRSTL